MQIIAYFCGMYKYNSSSFRLQKCYFYKKNTFHNLFIKNICTIESFFVLLRQI